MWLGRRTIKHMVHLILVLALAAFTLGAISLQKTYLTIPAREIKRRAQKGDAYAQIMHRATSYGVSLTLLLWAITGVSAALLFMLVARWFAWPVSLAVIIGLLWLGFAWLPNTRITALSLRFARLVTPPIAWVLGGIFPLLESIGRAIRHHSPAVNSTRIYEREDLLDLLKRQADQADNRVSREELAMARHALTFGSKLVRDVFTPLSQVKMVNQKDKIGPILMGELHASGHSRFPVYGGKKQDIVAILYLHDLVNKIGGGSVADIAKKQVVFVHEEQSLYQTLQAFLKTKRHLFIVVNRFEEIVGIVTIEDIIEQIIGQPIMDEFDQYEDLRAVAARMADKIHKDQKHQTPSDAAAVSDGSERPEISDGSESSESSESETPGQPDKTSTV